MAAARGGRAPPSRAARPAAPADRPLLSPAADRRTMALTLDHAVFTWDDHAAVVDACERAGLAPAYGGEHDGGETQNSLVAFPDGSYLELMAPTDPGARPDRWTGIVEGWAGPEAWCVRADVRSLLSRTVAAGAPVRGPSDGERERPDGTLVEWTTGLYGPRDLRSVLPFAIADRTPRGYRVPPAAVTDGPLTGVAEVVLGVGDPAPAAEWFGRLHGFPTPVEAETALPAAVSTVPGQPASFAVPEEGSALTERVADGGEGPVAFLLGTDDLAAARERYDVGAPEPWGDGRVAWFRTGPLEGTLGVLERA